MQAVFIVKSPLQYMNALEARHYFKIDPKKSLLVLMADKKSRRHLSLIASKDADWGGIIHLHEAPALIFNKDLPSLLSEGKGWLKLSVLDTFKLSRLVGMIGNLDYLLIGDVDNALMRHFSHKCKYERLIALDDGTKTLHSYKLRGSGLDKGPFPLKKAIKLWFKSLFFGLKFQPIKDAIFFTSYDIVPIKGDTKISNSFEYLKAKARETAKSENTFFIGGALVEADELTEQEYLSQLKLVASDLKNEKVLYVAHRRESSHKLKKIENELGWEVVLFDYPIEFQIAVVGPVPKKIVSFTSTALLNCHLLFHDHLDVISYRLSPHFFSSKDSEKGKRLLAIYDYFEASRGVNFSIKTLP